MREKIYLRYLKEKNIKEENISEKQNEHYRYDLILTLKKQSTYP